MYIIGVVDRKDSFMFLALTFKNIKKFIKTRPVLFFFIIISQIFCVLAVFSVAGMIDSVTPMPEDERGDFEKSFLVSFPDWSDEHLSEEEEIRMHNIYDLKTGDLVYRGTDKEELKRVLEPYEKADEEEEKNHKKITQKYMDLNAEVTENYKNWPKYKEVKNAFTEILKIGGKQLDAVEIYGYTDETFSVYFLGEYGSAEWMQKYLEPIRNVGNEKNITLTKSSVINTPYKNVDLGDKVKINNAVYDVVGLGESYTNTSQFYVTMMADVLDDDFVVEYIRIQPREDIDKTTLGKINEIIEKDFGALAYNIDKPMPAPLLEKQFNNLIYVVSFIMMFVLLLNVSRVYTYILSKRRKLLIVCMICGCSKGKMFIIYMIEVILMLLFSYAVGLGIFHFGLLNLISLIFPTFTEFFTLNIYLTVFGAYMLIGLIIMSLNVLPLVSKSAVSIKNGGK